MSPCDDYLKCIFGLKPVWTVLSYALSHTASYDSSRCHFSNKNVLHDFLLLCLIRLDFCQVIFSSFPGWTVDFLSISASNAVFVSSVWLLFPSTLLLVAFSSPKLFIYSSICFFGSGVQKFLTTTLKYVYLGGGWNDWVKVVTTKHDNLSFSLKSLMVQRQRTITSRWFFDINMSPCTHTDE